VHESKLEINGYGKPYLICWYDPKRRDWDDVISQAISKHKIDAKVPVLCLPKKDKKEAG